MTKKPIGLLTDFGLKDHYVASLKSVILRISPGATIFDVTHDVNPQDIRTAAFILSSVYSYAAKGTVFVVVVDPGVGSKRRGICVKTKNNFFVGPDNGVFSMVLAQERLLEARVIVNDRYFCKPVSSTFHGRDIFSPVGAMLSKRNIFSSLGPKIKNLKLLDIPRAIVSSNSIVGHVLHIDRFGNAITNISRDLIPDVKAKLIRTVRLKTNAVGKMCAFFSQGTPDQLIAVWNSNRLLELAIRESSAAKKHGIKIGDALSVTLHK